jgi:hypothetical protein
MKKFSLFISACLLLCVQTLVAQEAKLRVAVFDPAISGKSFDEGTGVIVREMVSTSLVETGKYTIIERSLIDKILKEQKFSNSGAVDESQVSQLGKLAGADKVIVCVLSSYGDKGMLSLKMIDVESAGIESQKSKVVNFANILDVIIPLTTELLSKPEVKPVASVKGTKNDASKGKSKPDKEEKKVMEKKPVEKTEKKTEKTFEQPVYDQSSTITTVLIEFKGMKNSRNPQAQIFVDDVSMGYGTLNEGFVINWGDNRPGKHKLRIEWSGVIPSKSYKINTQKEKRIVFDYVKGGFGYEFKLIK